ncbi:MAG: hypothetical protein QOI88_3185 [Gammaproteobacteria bacterium]|nr:hypothetical protein [Gammaproteobacteria bacterium]
MCNIGLGLSPSSNESIVNRTRILVALLVVVVLMQLFPERAGAIQKVAIIGGGLYFLAWAAARYLAQHKKKKAEAAQSVADDAEYQVYKRELDVIRATHDPTRDLNDPTSISPEYQAELSALHDKHQDMLARKFGPRS